MEVLVVPYQQRQRQQDGHRRNDFGNGNGDALRLLVFVAFIYTFSASRPLGPLFARSLFAWLRSRCHEGSSRTRLVRLVYFGRLIYYLLLLLLVRGPRLGTNKKTDVSMGMRACESKMSACANMHETFRKTAIFARADIRRGESC